MKIVLEGEERIRLEQSDEGFAFEAPGTATLSPFHLLAASLATCTFSVLVSWAEHARLEVGELAIEVDWELGGDPVRVSRMGMRIDWPELPEGRRQAAQRVAAQCTIHHTLAHGSDVATQVT